MLAVYLQDRNEEYLELADRMILGITNMRDRWIMPDGNLEYAYLVDDSMGFVDYTYLTYNDLFKVQLLLEQINGTRNADLDVLMKSKRTWMNANSSSDYLK
ncbi:hypothetical protein ASZ90_017974 [hydrocarbon metagenome]|uniref:Uncharacterized protein n=1 Tax=hydrocarbon metagenome TaxID=938273 RepID=A0A0W8E7J5_9ZZZZ